MKARRLLAAAAVCACAAFADDLLYDPAVVLLGTLEQGETRSVSATVVNASRKTIDFVDCVPQGRGPRNVQWPKRLAPGEKGTVSFEFDAGGLRGTIEENVTLVDKAEGTHPLPLSGEVTVPVEIWPAMPDFGFVGPKGAETVVYAFSAKKPGFRLLFDASQAGGLLSAKIEEVKLDVSGYPERVEESKSAKAVPGKKITLKLDPSKWPAGRNSLGVLATFSSPDFPKASPEFYAVGYRGTK